MKFIADAMLGRLAKRLRLLGYDVLYDPAWEDNEIIRLSLEHGRTILTRDTRLASRPVASNHILIEHDRVSAQVRQIQRQPGITAPPVFLSRCSRCNHPLVPAAKKDIVDLVPDHVYATKKDFFKCTGCGKVYWRGSHVRRMSEEQR
ncbi:MAG TPA: Mut7-C RNAse domain-containing protein [Nitrospirota bacterium]|nr:Mut7-C RNAse domain-containing protein [Nitrospirota bacterium]